MATQSEGPLVAPLSVLTCVEAGSVRKRLLSEVYTNKHRLFHLQNLQKAAGAATRTHLISRASLIRTWFSTSVSHHSLPVASSPLAGPVCESKA